MTLQQRNKIVAMFPELASFFATRPIDQPNSAADSLAVALLTKVEMVKGDKGDPGHTPVAGVDFLTKQEVNAMVQAILQAATPIKGRDYVDGKSIKGDKGDSIKGDKGDPGKDGTTDTPQQVANKLNTLKDAIEPTVVRGLLTMESVMKELKTGKNRLDAKDILNMPKPSVGGKGMNMSDQRWHGGGLSTSILTTKGDILGFSTTAARIPVGANDRVLVADSTQPLGVDWKPLGSVIIGGFTPGSVIFADSTGTLGEDNSQFFWDDTNNRLGIGANDPTAPLYVRVPSTVGNYRAIKLHNPDTSDGSGTYIQFSSSGPVANDLFGPQIGGSREVPGAGGLGYLWFATGTNSPAERMRITNGGLVGIGTSSPATNLEVYAASDANGLRVTNNTQSPIVGLWSNHASTDARNWDIITNNFNLGDFSIRYSASKGIAPAASALTITKTGNVGVGTTAAAQKFQVVGGALGVFSGASAGGVSIQGDISTGISGIFSDYNGGSEPKLHISTYSTRTGAGGITIDTSGNVGIGTTSPNALLEVNGTIRNSSAAQSVLSHTVGALSPTTDGNLWNALTGANIFIGTGITSGTIRLGPITGNLGLAILGSSGNGYVGIGTTSPLITLDVVRAGVNGVGDAICAIIGSDAKTAADAMAFDLYGQDSASNRQSYASLRARINDPTSGSEDSQFELYLQTAGANTLALTVVGGTVIPAGVVRLKSYTVATLPTGVAGDTAYVTDALAPAFGAAVAGSGAVGVPVYKDGTNWKVG